MVCKTICRVFSSSFHRASLTRNSQLKTFTKTIHTTITLALTWHFPDRCYILQLITTGLTVCLPWGDIFTYKYHCPSYGIYHFLGYYTTLSLSIHYFCSTRVEQHSRNVWLVTLAAQCLNPRDKDSETILQWAVNRDRSFCFVHKVPFWSCSLKASSKRSLFFTLKPSKRRKVIHKINWWP